jgi:choice-of-anchor B domain-containing protein
MTLTLKEMSRYVFLLLFSIAFAGRGQEVRNVSLLDHWYSDTLVTNTSNVRYSGCWGFTFEGKEYAAIGSTEGTHFFQITDANTLKFAGFIEGKFNSAQVIHREIKTYGHYAYLICDEGNSSLQIADLQFLPDSITKVADLQDERFGKIHNLFIDTANALLYACLVTPIVGGTTTGIVPLRVFSLNDPINPVLLWEGPEDIPEVHDCYVRGSIAFLNCGMDGIRIYDFGSPSSPILLNDLTFYQDQGYNHQGWLSPDGKTYVFADETDGKRVKKCSVGTNYALNIETLFGTNVENNSIPHNVMTDGTFVYVAYYNEGLRIFDIRNEAKEVGCYDTYTQESFFNMNGAWGVFAEYESGKIIVSDRQSGLYLFSWPKEIFSLASTDQFTLYPNPSNFGATAILRSPADSITSFEISIYNSQGKLVDTRIYENQSFAELDATLSYGVYQVSVRFRNYLNESDHVTLRWVIL